MAKYDIQELNYITAGKSLNTFNISYRYTDDGMILITDPSKRPASLSVVRTHTFFGDIGEYDTLSERFGSNKESFYDITNKIIIHNLYNINKTKIKTTADQYNTSSHKDIYVPYQTTDFIHMCLHKTNAYGLTFERNENPTMISVLMNNNANFDITYHYTLSSDNFHTFLYPKPEEVSPGCTTYTEAITNAHDLSNSCISTIFNIKRDLLGITHNYIVEIPENGKYIDYTRGYILGDTIIAKNHLNYLHTLSVDNNYNLSGCREYCNINSCGGLLYLTYRNNINYLSDRRGLVIYYDNKNNEYDKSMEIIQLTKKRLAYSYLHIDVIESLNRFDGDMNAGHKSSMFSIKLIDTGLNESTISENVKQKLRLNVTNNVREIINNIIPAHTQLFNIYFDGK